jgi:c-di-GMP-binding flagellar brake protein YcgR
VHGYFKDAPRLDETYGTQVVDVSAGGLLFLCQDSKLIQALKAGSPVSVRLQSKRRVINASGIIRRHYVGANEGYFGIEFSAMEPEDFRFLFEYLYGRPFTDGDAETVEGIRIHTL